MIASALSERERSAPFRAGSLLLASRKWPSSYSNVSLVNGWIYSLRLVLWAEYTMYWPSDGFNGLSSAMQIWRRFYRLSSSPILMTPFYHLQYIMTTSGSEELNIVCRWNDSVHDDLIVFGKLIERQRLKYMIRTLGHRVEMGLKELSFGLDESIVHMYCGSPVLDKNNLPTPGYSFLADPDNKFSDPENRYEVAMTRLLANMQIHGRELFRPGNEGAIEKYFYDCERLLQNLLILVHTTLGGTARATEITRWSYVNTDTPRSVFVNHNCVKALILYSKNKFNTRFSTESRSRVVPRYMPTYVSELLVRYLVIIRPFQIILLRFNKASQKALDIWRRSLWCNLRGRYNGQTMYTAMNRITKEFFGEPIRILMFRHYIEKMLTELVVKSESHIKVAVGLQGHSMNVSSAHYATTDLETAGVNRDTAIDEWMACDAWHQWIGMPSLESQFSSVHPETFFVMSQHQQEIDPIIPITPQPVETKAEAANLCLDALKALVKMGFYTFKSEYQATALQQVLENRESLLIVLPTGGGKSTMFLGPALIQDGINIVICPYVSLTSDLFRKASKLGIPTAIYGKTEHLQARLIFIVYEQILPESPALGWLNRVINSGQCKRIFFDEAHCLTTQWDWRKSIQELRYLVQAPCKYYFLSATLPKSLDSWFHEVMPVKTKEIRAPSTTRPEIQYSVNITEARRDSEVMDALMSYLDIEVYPEFERDPKSRAIIYIPFKNIAEDLKFEFAIYTADNVDTREDEFKAWTEGTKRIMLATSAFGVGIDYSRVSHVIHFMYVSSLVEFTQQSGRAARDGLPGKSHCILKAVSNNWMEGLLRVSSRQEHQFKTNDYELMKRYVRGQDCRRRVISSLFDTVEVVCLGRDGQLCDVCTSQGKSEAVLQPDVDDFIVDDLPDPDSLSQESSSPNLVNHNVGLLYAKYPQDITMVEPVLHDTMATHYQRCVDKGLDIIKQRLQDGFTFCLDCEGIVENNHYLTCHTYQEKYQGLHLKELFNRQSKIYETFKSGNYCWGCGMRLFDGVISRHEPMFGVPIRKCLLGQAIVFAANDIYLQICEGKESGLLHHYTMVFNPHGEDMTHFESFCAIGATDVPGILDRGITGLAIRYLANLTNGWKNVETNPGPILPMVLMQTSDECYSCTRMSRYPPKAVHDNCVHHVAIRDHSIGELRAAEKRVKSDFKLWATMTKNQLENVCHMCGVSHHVFQIRANWLHLTDHIAAEIYIWHFLTGGEEVTWDRFFTTVLYAVNK